MYTYKGTDFDVPKSKREVPDVLVRFIDAEGLVHGTRRGYRRHLQRGEEPCGMCILANREGVKNSPFYAKRKANGRKR